MAGATCKHCSPQLERLAWIALPRRDPTVSEMGDTLHADPAAAALGPHAALHRSPPLRTAMEISTKAMELAPNLAPRCSRSSVAERQLADFYDMDALSLFGPRWPSAHLSSSSLAAPHSFSGLELSTATAHLAIFLIGSYLVFSTYFVGDLYMKRHSTSSMPSRTTRNSMSSQT